MIPIKLEIQGLYSYKEKQIIEFDQLTAAGLFGIFGAVGSGKSSILEAVLLALYGSTERLSDRGEKNSMVNLQSEELLINCEFKAGKNNVNTYIGRYAAKRNPKKFDDVIIDAGGRDSTALRSALAVTDALVIPFAPRSLDVWALSDISSLIKEVCLMRDPFTVFAMLNNADPQGNDNEEAAAAVADFPEMQYIPTPIRRRKAIANAAGQGMGIMEYTPKDTKGIEEMTALVKAVFGSK